MIWGLIGLITLAAILALLITKRNVRKALPVAVALVISVIAFFAWYQQHELDLSRERISLAEVELADVQWNQTNSAGVREIAGRIRNHSAQYTLLALVMRVSMEDCIADKCEVVDQADIAIKPKIPPGQARDFRERVYFKSTLAPRGQIMLHQQIVSTRSD